MPEITQDQIATLAAARRMGETAIEPARRAATNLASTATALEGLLAAHGKARNALDLGDLVAFVAAMGEVKTATQQVIATRGRVVRSMPDLLPMLPGDESDPAGDALEDVLAFATIIVPDPEPVPAPEPEPEPGGE